MIRALVDFALDNRLLMVAMATLLFMWGGVSFRSLPIEAYPDVANNYVNVITQWPGRAAEEVEQQVTIPIEIVMNGLPHLEHLRSTSLCFHQDKEQLIAAMNRELVKIPGVIWNFSQPIADNMEEAVSGVKGELAIKIYGDDLKLLEDKGDQILRVMRGIQGIQDLGLFRVIGQPNLNLEVDRERSARYQINVADVQDAIQTAVGGNAVSQVLQGEQRYDLVMRYLPRYRDTKEAIEDIRLLSPSGERVSLAQLCKVQVQDGASEIYREANSRYVAIKSVCLAATSEAR